MKSLLWLFLLPVYATAYSGESVDRGSVSLTGGVSGLFDSERNPVVMLDYRFANQWKGLRPWLGLSWATDGAVYAGGGAVYTFPTLDGVLNFSAGFGPGYYERHQGADLGSHLEFLSFAEVAYRLLGEHRLVLRLAHISNGGITQRNPGTELLMLGYAMPLP